MTRIKQLDSLRAIAIILVMVHHSPLGLKSAFLHDHLLGANMFMVLSGYLITSILLREKKKAEISGVNNWVVFKNFFARRALRIFPLYFAVLLFIGLRGNMEAPHLLSLATFTSNFYIFFKQDWSHLSHTWTLSVQEQFYFFWPLVLLFTPKRLYLAVILGFIVIGAVSGQFLFPGEFGKLLTITCFDALGFGALLAWMLSQQQLHFDKAYKWLCAAALSSFLFVVASYLLKADLPLAFRTFYAVMIMWVIANVIHKGANGIMNKWGFLDHPVLLFIGKISFGLYLLHPVIPNFAYPKLQYLNGFLPSWTNTYMEEIILVETYLLIFVSSWLSYHIIEMPFLKLKRFFVVEKSKTVEKVKEQKVLYAEQLPAA